MGERPLPEHGSIPHAGHSDFSMFPPYHRSTYVQDRGSSRDRDFMESQHYDYHRGSAAGPGTTSTGPFAHDGMNAQPSTPRQMDTYHGGYHAGNYFHLQNEG